jgi:hypothetical protein
MAAIRDLWVKGKETRIHEVKYLSGVVKINRLPVSDHYRIGALFPTSKDGFCCISRPFRWQLFL